MWSMKYCKRQNLLTDYQDILEWWDYNLSDDEEEAKEEFIKLFINNY